eukprot:5115856-Prymnesium_polylepis.1
MQSRSSVAPIASTVALLGKNATGGTRRGGVTNGSAAGAGRLRADLGGSTAAVPSEGPSSGMLP